MAVARRLVRYLGLRVRPRLAPELAEPVAFRPGQRRVAEGRSLVQPAAPPFWLTARSARAKKTPRNRSSRGLSKLSPGGPEYQLAVERDRAAIRQRPRFADAHASLAQAYAGLGRKQEAAVELELAGTMRKAASNDDPPYLKRLFEGSLLEAEPPHDW